MEHLVRVDEKDMTKRQKTERKVSLFDNRSKLGQVRIQAAKSLKRKKRIKRRTAKKSRQKNR